MLTYIILGITQGAVLGLLALGIVLVYKGTRVLNFAQGEFGTIAAYAASIMTAWVLPDFKGKYFVAILLALALSALVGYLVDLVIVRRLFDAPRVTLLVATAGFALLAVSLEAIFAGLTPRSLANLREGNAISFFGAIISWQRLMMLLILVGLSVGLAYFFNKTDTGLAVLATSQEPVATELVGIGTRRMSSLIWIMAGALGGIAGILQGPDTTITPFFVTSGYLLLAFGAAVVGGITSLAGALVGGQVIGVFSQLATYFNVNYIKDIIEIPAFEQLLVFILLVTVLVVRPRGLMGTEA